MPSRFNATFEDFAGKRFWVRFHADTLADAETICIDLLGITAATWVQLWMDGILWTPFTPLYQQPPSDAVSWRAAVKLHFTLPGERRLHRLTMRAVLPAYANHLQPLQVSDPFSDVSKFKTADGTPFALFHHAEYFRTN